MRAKQQQTVRAFTLVEMTIVITIAVILMAIAMPAIPEMLRSNRMSGAKTMIRSALSQAQNYAAREQKYAGIRFQADDEGNQSLIFIEHSPVKVQLSPNDELANRFTAIANKKILALPTDTVCIRSSGKLGALRDAEAGFESQIWTFSVIFGPDGQLVALADHSCLPRYPEALANPYTQYNPDTFDDGVFAGPGVVVPYNPAKPSLPSDPWGLNASLIRRSDTGFYLAQTSAFLDPAIAKARRVTDFLSQHRGSKSVERLNINVYTGSLIED